MVARSLTCDTSRLRSLLEDQLDEEEQGVISQHLESCPTCRKALERMAAESRWWGDARLLASGPPTHTPEASAGETDALAFLEPATEPGQLGKLGPYEVMEVIGRGGMGLVLKAYDRPLGRHVAIKVLAPELATSASARRRFAREAQAAAAISHDHIVAIYAVDTTLSGLPFLVMPFVSGRSLQDRLEAMGPLKLREILRIGRQAASGLAAAHAVGLVHRDIKPANILLENCVERVKVTDFGLARAADDASLTQSGVIAGTPQYMAPEQARGESIDHRADLFSLGSVLYTLCTGRSPFRAETTMGVLRRVCEDRPRPIREISPEIPDWFQAIVAKLLAKAPADRFQSAAEVAELFERCLAYLEQPGRQPPFPVHRPSGMRLPSKPLFMAAAALLVAFVGLGAAEASGASNLVEFVATVLRIKTPEGTLVVKLDDPEVKVRVDGEEVVFTGAGPQEIRLKLRAGDHWVEKTKGTRVGRELVSIRRGDKQTVLATVEPDSSQAQTEENSSSSNKRLPDILAPSVTQDQGADKSAANEKAVLFWESLVENQDAIREQLAAKDAQLKKLAESVRLLESQLEAARASSKGKWPATQGKSSDADLDRHLLPLYGKQALALKEEELEKAQALLFSLHRRVRNLETDPAAIYLRAKIQKMEADPALQAKLALQKPPMPSPPAPSKPILPKFAPASNTWKGTEPYSIETSAWVLSVAVSPDGNTLAAGCSDGVIRLFGAGTLDRLAKSEGEPSAVRALVFSPNGETLASAGSQDGEVVLWDVREKRIRQTLKGHAKTVLSVAFSPAGETLATGSQDKTARLWDVTSGKLRAVLNEHKDDVCSVVFQPITPALTVAVGKRDSLATIARDGEVKFWHCSPGNAHDGQLWGGLPPLVEEVGSFSFSQDGKTLAIGSRHGTGQVILIDIASPDVSSWKEKGRFEIPNSVVTGFAFSPNGRNLYVAAADESQGSRFASELFVWDLTALKQAGRSQLLPYRIECLMFTPDGECLVTGGLGAGNCGKLELRVSSKRNSVPSPSTWSERSQTSSRR